MKKIKLSISKLVEEEEKYEKAGLLRDSAGIQLHTLLKTGTVVIIVDVFVNNTNQIV